MGINFSKILIREIKQVAVTRESKVEAQITRALSKDSLSLSQASKGLFKGNRFERQVKRTAQSSLAMTEAQKHDPRMVEKEVAKVMKTLERYDSYTAGHSKRVAEYSVLLGKGLGLSKQRLWVLQQGGLLHDIGKINVPKEVLHKPAQLNDAEFVKMKHHADSSGDLLAAFAPFRMNDGVPEIANIGKYHHEQLNGKGYHGLTEKELPLLTQIVSVADTFDAMTSTRPYRQGMDPQIAIQRLRDAAGQLNPKLVEVFVSQFEKVRGGKVLP